MFPTLKSGQDILCFNWAYLWKNPKIGDVVVINLKGKDMIKRVRQISSDRGIFVQGDNEKESTDSRKFGVIDRSTIIGKVIFVR